MQLKTYKKDFDYSYSFGVFPTLELLTHRPDKTLRVVAHSKGEISSGIDKLEALCARHKIPFEVNDKVVDRLSHKGNVYVFGVFQKYSSALEPTANHLMLVNPSDMGNLGTISRTMLGFETRDLAMLSPAVDIYNPHVVRASMGATFALRFEYFDRIEDYLERFPHTLYPFMLGAQKMLPHLTLKPPHTLVFGPEGAGLPESYRDLGESVMIPQGSLIESLNLAVAVSIALYEAYRSSLP